MTFQVQVDFDMSVELSRPSFCLLPEVMSAAELIQLGLSNPDSRCNQISVVINRPVQIDVAAAAPADGGGRAGERVLGAHVEHGGRRLGPEHAQRAAAPVPLGRLGGGRGRGGLRGRLLLLGRRGEGGHCGGSGGVAVAGG